MMWSGIITVNRFPSLPPFAFKEKTSELSFCLYNSSTRGCEYIGRGIDLGCGEVGVNGVDCGVDCGLDWV